MSVTMSPRARHPRAALAGATLVLVLAGLTGCGSRADRLTTGDAAPGAAAGKGHHGRHGAKADRRGKRKAKSTTPPARPTSDPAPTTDGTSEQSSTPNPEPQQSSTPNPEPQQSSTPDPEPQEEPPATRLTPAGTHQTMVSGTVRSSLGSRPVDPDGQVRVGAPNGESQLISITNSALLYEFTQRLTGDGLTVSQIHLRTDLFDVTFSPSQGLLLPARPEPGQRWSWSARSDDDSSTLSFEARYLGRDSVSLAGSRVTTHHLAVTLTSTGRVVFTSTSDRHLAVTTLLPVSERTQTHGRSRGISFNSDIDAILRSASGT
jgi:hypothetical protein